MTAKVKEVDDHGLSQAKLQLSSILEMVAALKAAGSDERARDDAREVILQDALSVETRTDWASPGADYEPGEGEYRILLCTGGPACRVIGTLERGEPSTARIEYQDWFTPWVEHRITHDEEVAVLEYAACFYYGE